MAIDHEKMERIHKAEKCRHQKLNDTTIEHLKGLMSVRGEYSQILNPHENNKGECEWILQAINNVNHDIKLLLNL